MKKLSLTMFLMMMAILSITKSGEANANDEPCLEVARVKIVVIGSADGTENTGNEAIWISKYRDYIKTFNQDNEVINLTKEGINSYHLMASGNSAPYGRPHADAENNITKAIGYHPDAILVNLQANDLLSGFKPNEQIVNFMLLANLANKNNIPVWVSTPYPRAFDSLNNIVRQEEIKELISQRFDPFMIDFWSNLATEEGTLKPAYAAANGTMVNANGQELMLKSLIDANVHQFCARKKFFGGKDLSLYGINATKQVSQNDQDQLFQVTIANSGETIYEDIPITLQLTNNHTGEKLNAQKVINGGLEGCQFKSVEFNMENLSKGEYAIRAFINRRIDKNAKNDTTSFNYNHLVSVNPTSKEKDLWEPKKPTLVKPGTSLYAISIDGFSTQFNRVNKQEGYRFSNTLEAKIYQEPKRSENTINGESKENQTITHFDIIADRNIEIDGFELKIEKPGGKLIEIFYQKGDNKANRNWRQISSLEVMVKEGDKTVEVPSLNIGLERNETAKIYIKTKDITGLSFSLNK
ncbi:SGNH/GDSL hydrolase family protein [Fulvivirgaceae bacterium BMA10]|uniref:SGNH/GDSL hydrolase family protein n=1 Tax=Splendidivirga corallicola TaxID=3051826 RepID=A0ABT8KIV9_9BACT|nr:SGNH/GDSL hydrolase family protein [Fulvivirgaceae bacterium BMA10]